MDTSKQSQGFPTFPRLLGEVSGRFGAGLPRCEIDPGNGCGCWCRICCSVQLEMQIVDAIFDDLSHNFFELYGHV